MQILPLNSDATPQEIIQNLSKYKIAALNYATNIANKPNFQNLEIKEIKLLTDLVLNLEDSIKFSISEVQEAKTIHRLLQRFA